MRPEMEEDFRRLVFQARLYDLKKVGQFRGVVEVDTSPVLIAHDILQG